MKATENLKHILVNRTGEDVSLWRTAIGESVLTGVALPDDIADLFNLERFTRPDGTPYGILTFVPDEDL